MKKITTNLFFALAILSGVYKMKGQAVSTYTFAQSASTYSAITGNVLGNNSNDDDIFDNVPIGFNFIYGGVNFNQLSVCANGFIKPGVLLNNSTYNPISDSFGDDTTIAALGNDIESTLSGILQYTTTGTTPNRVFIVQWNDYTSYGNNDILNFQIRLHETSNVIDVYYDNFTIDVYNPYEVGLRGILLNNDYNNRSVLNLTNTWATSTAGTSEFDYCELDPGPPQFAPTSGQLYTWGPVPCSGPPTAGSATGPTVACVGQVLNLGLTGSTQANGLTFQWQSSPNGVTWTSVGTPTTVMAFNPTYTTTIYYRCIVACGSNTAVSTALNIIPQTANVYATVPLVENFDNTWQDRCDTRNVPVTANWSSNPTTGDNSWRRQDDGISANWSSSGGIEFPFDGIGCADFNTYDASAGMTGDMDLYVNMGTTSNYQLSFYHINPSGDDSLYISLSTNGGLTFSPVTNFASGDYSAADVNWNQKIINLGPVNSTSCVVRFHAISDFGIDDIAMDSLQIKTFVCAAPNITLAASQTTACSGASVNITASGATTYTWNTASNSTSITVNPTVTTVYTVNGETTPGCIGSKTIAINVTPGPAITFSASPSLSVCPGGSAVITASGASSYTWAAGNQTTAAISVTPAISTVYNIVGTNALGCTTNANVTLFVVVCTNVQPQTITVNNTSIYPNPNKGEFTVELANGVNKDIQVLDLTGRVVATGNTTEDAIKFNINNLANGIYYVKVRSANSHEVFKVIKE